jgi:hypothetical protein
MSQHRICSICELDTVDAMTLSDGAILAALCVIPVNAGALMR